MSAIMKQSDGEAAAADPARATIKEISAALGLPVRTAQDRANKGGWLYNEQFLPQGGVYRLYHVPSLPEPVRDALLDHHLRTVPDRRHARGVTVGEIDRRLALAEQAKLPSQLDGWQRSVRDARMVLLHELDTLALRGDLSRGCAIDLMVEIARKGELAPELAARVPVANARSGDGAAGSGRTLSRSSLYRWLRVRDELGPDALAPKAPPERGEPVWFRTFLTYYARPQKPSIAWCLEKMAEDHPGQPVPSAGQVRRQLDKLTPQQLNKGRVGAREMKRMRAYVARDVANLWPGAVYVADGHTFDAEIAHPQHGQPFRPEVTTVIDVYSRRIVGWSAGVVEKTATVADAMLNAFVTAGVCGIWYVDRGKGFNNHAMDDDLTGLLARVGVLKENSLPYNSQARGVVERAHQSLWVRAAKELPTYMGADMDPEAKQVAHKITRGELKQTATSRLLPAWRPALEFLAAQVAAYNNRPHSTLPKTRDPETGKVRHRTPNEAWALGVEDHGAPEILTETEALAAFRPQERRKTRRGLLSLWHNSYFHTDLEAFHDEWVRVTYDIHDAGKVWVYSLDGAFICQAVFEANKRDFFPVSKAEMDQQKRTKGRLRRHDRKREEILAEAGPGLLELSPAAPALSADEQAAADAEFARLSVVADASPAEPVPPPPSEPPPVSSVSDAPAIPSDARPTFADDAAWAAWLTQHPTRATAQDRAVLRDELRRSHWRDLMDAMGVDLTALQAIAEAAEAKEKTYA